MSLTSQVNLLATRIGQEIKSVKASVAAIPGAKPPVTLTDAATIATNAALGNYFRVSIALNRTLGVPTNPTDGQTVVWEITASGGFRTLTLSTAVGGFMGATRIPTIRTGHTFLLRAVYKASINKWMVDAPEAFGEMLYATTQAERDAYLAAFGFVGMQVCRMDLPGAPIERHDGTVWHSNAVPAQVQLASTAGCNPNTALTEMIWGSATIADPGYVYRVAAGGKAHVFINNGTAALLRIRIGLTGTADLSLPMFQDCWVENNDITGVRPVLPEMQTGTSYSGSVRVVWTIQKQSGSGNFDLPVNDATGWYRIVPA